MSRELWRAVDEYAEAQLFERDEALEQAYAGAAAAGLPAIAVTPEQGRLLALLIRMQGASRVLEVGALAGYSTIWMARALAPGGRLVSLEIDPRAVAAARTNVARAGLAERVEVREGPAMEGMRALISEQAEPFDFVFIDADKANTPNYFELALELTRPGSVIVADNVVRDGRVVEADSDSGEVRGNRRFLELAGAEARFTATLIQTVGAKGYDGFAIGIVEDPAAPRTI